MLEAAKFGDPVLGVDIHMVLVPAPPAPAPIPTPLPHPFVGVVFDPLGAALGAALGLAFGGGGPVLINYMPCGNTGTDVKGVPHFPTPPGVSFAPNDIPSNDGTLIFGSKTVTMAGSSIARLTDLVMTCNFPINLPTSVCMAVPMGAPVLVGGPPSMDWFAAITKAIRTKWFSDALHRVLKVAPGSRLSKVICFLTGHPVDVMTGEVLTDATDFELPGPLPLKFERNYYSRSEYAGPLGKGWTHSLDVSVHEEDWRLVVRLADGRERYLPRIPEGARLWDDIDRCALERAPWGYALTTSEGLTYTLARVEGARVTHPLVRVTDRSGNALTLRHERGVPVEVTDSAGRSLRFEHRADGRLERVSVRRPGEQGARWMELARYAYGPDGVLTTVSDALGHPHRYEYRGGVLVRETDRGGLSFHFEYDHEHPSGWCTRTWGDGGIYDRRITYDKHRHVTLVDDSRGGRTHYFGTAAGLVTKKIDPTGGEWSYAWDDAFRKTAETDPLGNRTEWAYDARGNKVLERDPLGHETRWTYDAHGAPVSRESPTGARWVGDRDARGKLVSLTDPLGLVHRYEYDARGLLTAVVGPCGVVQRMEYDAQGNLARALSGGGAASRMTCDDLGSRVARVDADGRSWRFGWDALRRLVEVRTADGFCRTLRRDAAGNVTAVGDGERELETFACDGMGRVRERRDGDGRRVRLEYDAEGALVEVSGDGGVRFAFEYDVGGRVRFERRAGIEAREYRYDRAGRCVAVVSPGGRVARCEYDARGLLLARAHRDGSGARYRYDANRALVEASNEWCEVTFERDPAGRVVAEVVGDSARVESVYDGHGRRTRAETSVGRVLRFHHDPDGGLRELCVEATAGWRTFDARGREGFAARAAPGASVRIERDPVGRELVRRAPGGAVARRTRGDDGRVRALEIAREGRPLRAEAYRWKRGGGLEGRIDSQRGATWYEYDQGGHLAGSRGATGEVVRVFDRDGNPHRAARGDDRTWRDGRLVACDGAALRYDDEGRLLQREGAASVTRYQWNDEGRLVAVTVDAREVARFAYDALGRRIRKTAGGRERRYVWDGDHVVHELEAGRGAVTWAWEPGEFTPALRCEEGAVYSVVPDVSGAPRALVDGGGAVAWEDAPDVYGVPSEGAGDARCPWRWPGQYADEETGLHYNGHRYYDPRSGVYLSPDPLGVWGGAAEYSFVRDPFQEMDPYGLAPFTPEQSIVNAWAREASETVRRGKPPWSSGSIDALIEMADSVGLPVRAGAADLGIGSPSHWAPYGTPVPHVHVGAHHVPVPPGYVPPGGCR
jgi:RHS repeat-associated protein